MKIRRRDLIVGFAIALGLIALAAGMRARRMHPNALDLGGVELALDADWLVDAHRDDTIVVPRHHVNASASDQPAVIIASRHAGDAYKDVRQSCPQSVISRFPRKTPDCWMLRLPGTEDSLAKGPLVRIGLQWERCGNIAMCVGYEESLSVLAPVLSAIHDVCAVES